MRPLITPPDKDSLPFAAVTPSVPRSYAAFTAFADAAVFESAKFTLSEIFVSAGLYSPPPVKKLSCCPAAAGGTRPLVPALDAVAPSYSGTEMIPLVFVSPSPICCSVIRRVYPLNPPPSPISIALIAARGKL